jgi:hypothetical protein
MSNKKETIDLNKNPRSVDNFLAKFIDSKYLNYLNTLIGNGETVNDYGMQICKQLNIDENDLLDKTVE